MDKEEEQKSDSQEQAKELNNLEKEAEAEEEQAGKPSSNSYFSPKLRGLLFHFLISFVAGILASSIVVYIYATHVPKIPKFYSFDLSTMIQQKEVQILKHPNQNMKAEIDAYISNLQKYVNSYASHGIVFVTGVSIGNSPYVKDITKGFTGSAANANQTQK